ncbi:hypothetical protein FACS1894180_3300 [Bacteroidia bacterium]|nr:hypothetical protein FACS1894180_3300 [Bacteroidia bacterium]
MKKIFLTFAFLLIFSNIFAENFVKTHGKLSVQGTQLVDKNGEPLVLRGVSFGWTNFWERFYNKDAVRWLHKDWKINVIRASMGIDIDEKCYLAQPEHSQQLVENVIQAAIKEGIYVIVDWHSHNIHTAEAVDFFNRISKKYAKFPNIIYEIFNEPDYETWDEVKQYSETVIATIRANDADNLILVGCPHWDQDIHLPAENPILGQKNLLYTLHYYASTHFEWLRQRAEAAMAKGIPVFISESAGMEASGDGAMNYPEWQTWIDWGERNKLSWITWSISDKNETCSMLLPTAASKGKWKLTDLRESGIKTREFLRKMNMSAPPSPPKRGDVGDCKPDTQQFSTKAEHPTLRGGLGGLFVRTDSGHFTISEKPYYFIGTNFWYGAILGSQGQGGNRQRLVQELDFMQSIGINNLRILAGADGAAGQAVKIRPTLQQEPSVYNDTIFDGLDFLLAEMGKRQMYAVLYLNNSWEWSGGYGQYLEWAGQGKVPEKGVQDWQLFQAQMSKYADCDSCHTLFFNHIKNVLSRTNRYTGKPYTADPAIMAWQIGNEPRVFDGGNKKKFVTWLSGTAALIRSLDKNHLISTGNEGFMGSEMDWNLVEKINADTNIDYITIHIWAKNWSWIAADKVTEGVDTAIAKTNEYIAQHLLLAEKLGKPLVIEEFGYPRDNHEFTVESTTTARDKYYKNIFAEIVNGKLSNGKLCGCNFWAWGGCGRSAHLFWQPSDDYLGDPAQEEQGLNSVFNTDATINIINKYTSVLNISQD